MTATGPRDRVARRCGQRAGVVAADRGSGRRPPRRSARRPPRSRRSSARCSRARSRCRRSRRTTGPRTASRRGSGCTAGASRDAARTAFGPNRPPTRYVTPVSNGTPTIATSTSSSVRTYGSRANVDGPGEPRALERVLGDVAGHGQSLRTPAGPVPYRIRTTWSGWRCGTACGRFTWAGVAAGFGAPGKRSSPIVGMNVGGTRTFVACSKS